MRVYVGVGLGLVLLVCGGCAETGSGRSPGTGASMDGSRLSICYSSEDCTEEGLVCYGAMLSGPEAGAGFCTQSCTEDADCDPIGGMTATCAPTLGQCRVDCTGSGSGDGRCPEGMTCRDADPREDQVAPRCMYPAGTGSEMAAGEWGRCDPTHGDLDCAGELTCVASGFEETSSGYCATSCDADEQCAAPAGSGTIALCPGILGACSLDCAGANSTCPQGMQCVEVFSIGDPILRCRYASEQSGAQE